MFLNYNRCKLLTFTKKKKKKPLCTCSCACQRLMCIYICVCVRTQKLKWSWFFPPKPNVSKYWSSHNVRAKRSKVHISKIQKVIKLKPIIGNSRTCLLWWRASQCCIWKARNWMQATFDRKQCSSCFEFIARASLRFFFSIFACACHIEVTGYCWKIKFW